MKQEIKISKYLIGILSIFLLLSVLVNYNSENGCIIINSSVLSNNLLLTLLGGICTGIIAVLIEKLYKYHLDIISIRQYIYYDAIILYSEIYYWICNIKELENNKQFDIPENIFSNKLLMVKNYIWRLKSYDYENFLKPDSIKKAHEVFILSDANYILEVLELMNYLTISILKYKINKLENNVDNKDDIYAVLSIIESKLLICNEKIEKLISVFDMVNVGKHWCDVKNEILNSCINCQSLEEFINKNSKK